MFRFAMGDLCKDMVSGWEGIVTGRYEYMNGCVRYCLDGKDKDGNPKGWVFDEQQLVLVKAKAVTPQRPLPEQPEAIKAKPVATRPGGPNDAPPSFTSEGE